jgi:hypothetical protein
LTPKSKWSKAEMRSNLENSVASSSRSIMGKIKRNKGNGKGNAGVCLRLKLSGIRK